MSITLEQAKNAPLDGSARLTFAKRPDVVWSIVGRYPEDPRHPERIRVIIENPEQGESYFTEGQLDRIIPVDRTESDYAHEAGNALLAGIVSGLSAGPEPTPLGNTGLVVLDEYGNEIPGGDKSPEPGIVEVAPPPDDLRVTLAGVGLTEVTNGVFIDPNHTPLAEAGSSPELVPGSSGEVAPPPVEHVAIEEASPAAVEQSDSKPGKKSKKG